jgi:hypothetical protein
VFVVSIADRDGAIVASNPSMPAQDVSRAPYFTVHANDTGHALRQPDCRRRRPAEPHLHFTRRIDDAFGRFAGVAIVEVDPAYFTSAYERSRAGELGLLGLIGSDGVARAVRIGDKVSWGQQVALDASAKKPSPRTPPRRTACCAMPACATCTASRCPP